MDTEEAHQIIDDFLNGKITHPLKRNGITQHITIGISDGGPADNTRVTLLYAKDDAAIRMGALINKSYMEGYRLGKAGAIDSWFASDSLVAKGKILEDFNERQK